MTAANAPHAPIPPAKPPATGSPADFRSIPAAELSRLREGLRSGRLQAPLQPLALFDLGLSDPAACLAACAGLERGPLLHLLHAVLAERRAQPPEPELVWTGPSGPGALSRDTRVVFTELVTGARRSVWLAGYTVDHGAALFAPLHAAMQQRGVQATFLLHLESPSQPKQPWSQQQRTQPRTQQRSHQRSTPRQTTASSLIERFLQANWPFGPPEPAIYFDPRTLEPQARASMHLKALVVDEQRTLIGSANFTDRGHSRNLEAGALIHSPHFARSLAAQFHSLIATGQLQAHGAHPAHQNHHDQQQRRGER